MSAIAPGIKRGSAALAILAVLAERPLHGYEIAKQIERETRGALTFPRFALSDALSFGKARLGEGCLGDGRVRAGTPLLSADRRREAAACLFGRAMEGVFQGAGSAAWGGPCLTGSSL